MKSIAVLLILFCLCQGKEKGKEKGKDKDKEKDKGNGCPTGWTKYRERCYYISDHYASFDVAKKHCETDKSQLATALTCDEEVDLTAVLESHRGKCDTNGKCVEFWIGIHDLKGNQNWTTAQGVKVDKNGQFWADGYPKDFDGRCGFMSFRDNKRGAWKNGNCDSQLKFACITCPYDFEYFPEVNECLYLIRDLITWTDAQKACAKLKRDAEMVTIRDSVKQEAVGRYLQHQIALDVELNSGFFPYDSDKGTIAWIGGQTRDPKRCDTPYVWKPVATYAYETPFTYTNWYLGQPDCDSNKGYCVAIQTLPESSYRWHGKPCSMQYYSLCEF